MEQVQTDTHNVNADEAATKVKAPGVGDLAKEMIRNRATNEEVLAAVKEKFPEAKTSMASVNWYRNFLRGEGENVPTARELKAGSKAEEKAAKEQAKAEAKAAKDAAKAEAKALKDAEKAEKKRLADEAKAKAKADKEAEKQAEAEAETQGEAQGESAGQEASFLE